MATSTVTSKGQITVPVEVRRALGLKPGSRVDFVRNRAGVYELIPETRSVESLKGLLAGRRAVTLDEMDAAISNEAGEGTI
jgi:antitoxin PrlF